MVEIEADRCTRCGWCVDECPAGIIKAGPPGGAPPAMQPELQDRCSLCGHCVAICPTGALSHRALPAEGFEERTCRIAPDAMRDFLLLRRSTRSFKEEGVPREVLERLIEAGTHAGTASNAQTEGFVIVRDRALLEELESLVVGIMWKKLRPLGNPLGRKLARLRYGDAMVERSMRYYERFREARRKGRPAGVVLRKPPPDSGPWGAVEPVRPENCAIAVRNMEMMAPEPRPRHVLGGLPADRRRFLEGDSPPPGAVRRPERLQRHHGRLPQAPLARDDPEEGQGGPLAVKRPLGGPCDIRSAKQAGDRRRPLRIMLNYLS